MPHAHQEQAGMPPFSNYKGEDIMAFRSLRKTEKHRRKEPAMITQDMLGELLQLERRPGLSATCARESGHSLMVAPRSNPVASISKSGSRSKDGYSEIPYRRTRGGQNRRAERARQADSIRQLIVKDGHDFMD